MQGGVSKTPECGLFTFTRLIHWKGVAALRKMAAILCGGYD